MAINSETRKNVRATFSSTAGKYSFKPRVGANGAPEPLSPREIELLQKDMGEMEKDAQLGDAKTLREFKRARAQKRSIDEYMAGEEEKAKGESDKLKSRDDQFAADVDAFYKQAIAPIDPNDPYVRQLTANVSNQAGTEAARRGINGPIAVSNASEQVMRAQTGLQEQRKGLGLQALGLTGNHLASLQGQQLQRDQMAMQERQYAYQMQMQQQMAIAQAQQAKGQGIGSMIGGGLGMIGGGALGWAASGGNPMGLAVGAGMGGQFGSGLGGGLGGMSSGGGYAPAAPYGASYMGYTGSGSSRYGGGRGY